MNETNEREVSERKYTNKELAKNYFKVVAQYVSNAYISHYNLQRINIENLDVDIWAFYRERRSLNELKNKKIDKKTKKILELILESGVNEARRKVEEEKINEIRKSQRESSRRYNRGENY